MSPRTSSKAQISEGILRNQKIIIGLDSFSNQRLKYLAHSDYTSLCIDHPVEKCKITVIIFAPCCQIYRATEHALIFIFMLRVLSVCLSVVLVGVFFDYYGRVAAFLVVLLKEHLDEPVEMLSFPPRLWLYLQQHFVIHVLAS